MVLVIKKTAKKKELEKIVKEIKRKKLFKASEFCGKIKVKGDAVEIQRSLRNEWK
ncbi:MAG: hypothetical protein M3R36_16385 [Bacteroidota bacterium]|nr:hypothetical protein [Bacteroidota bacterium]